MSNLVEYVTTVVKRNGGWVVGKTRLQKICYILEACGVGYGIDFDYHNYGPFSTEVAIAADDAHDSGLLSLEEKPGHHSVPYVVFKDTGSLQREHGIDLEARQKEVLGVTEKYSAVVLELAATAHYLKTNGFGEDCWNELEKRKSLKATKPRLQKAKQLLIELGLENPN